jgi:capsid protein
MKLARGLPQRRVVVDRRPDTRFGFDAVKSTGRRKLPANILRSADDELTQSERGSLIANGRDIVQNFSLAAWAVRRHLDYVSTFTFQARTGDRGLNKEIEQFVEWAGAAENYDVAGRYSLSEATRMAEAARTVAGDILEVRMSDGRVQFVESDRIRDPIDSAAVGKYDRNRIFHGVLTNESGRHLAYAVHRRRRRAGGFDFERWVPAHNAYLFGYFDRFDQVRGVELLAPALNMLRDTYKGVDFALGKMLVSQLFGLVFYRDSLDSVGESVNESGEPAEADDTNQQEDFKQGPVKLDMEREDKVEFLESKTPSVELQQFLQATISLSIKSLDLPFSFYDESFSSWSGQRQAQIQYALSAHNRQKSGKARLNSWTDWRIPLAVDDGQLKLPFEPSKLCYEWVPKGIPWVDPLKEVQAWIAAIEAGLTSRTLVIKTLGLDPDEVWDDLQAEQKAASDRGLVFGAAVAANIQQPPEVVVSGK